MKTIVYLIAGLVGFLACLASAAQASTGDIRLSLVEGDVQIRSQEADDWFAASINMPIADGDRLWVPSGGRLELQTRNGNIRLDENSAIEVFATGNRSTQFYLSEGRLYANFRNGRDAVMQIDTPVSSLRVYDRSVFMVDVRSGGETELSVLKGVAYAENRAGSTRVGSGRTLALGEETADLFPLGAADAWERWNRARDRRFDERFASTRYLPSELGFYAPEFDEYGKWVYLREYGYVWTPTVHINVGWAPYRQGRWVWLAGDYVWIGYEPWGWVPYHYGRWVYVARAGWCWVPPVRGAVYWGPGYVGWVQTPTYVAWVPLAPGEIYYGYGYYGPHSIDVRRKSIAQTTVVYRNVYVRNAVTIIHLDTFVRGRHAEVTIRDNPFLKEKIRIGRPEIRPERDTLRPVLRDIPKEKEPPRSVRELKAKELKRERPFVRERSKSVLAPERPARELKVKPVVRPKEESRGEKGKGDELTPRGRTEVPAGGQEKEKRRETKPASGERKETGKVRTEERRSVSPSTGAPATSGREGGRTSGKESRKTPAGTEERGSRTEKKKQAVEKEAVREQPARKEAVSPEPAGGQVQKEGEGKGYEKSGRGSVRQSSDSKEKRGRDTTKEKNSGEEDSDSEKERDKKR